MTTTTACLLLILYLYFDQDERREAGFLPSSLGRSCWDDADALIFFAKEPVNSGLGCLHVGRPAWRVFHIFHSITHCFIDRYRLLTSSNRPTAGSIFPTVVSRGFYWETPMMKDTAVLVSSEESRDIAARNGGAFVQYTPCGQVSVEGPIWTDPATLIMLLSKCEV
jgi:hypothetical protein